jgi:hypothetical protein
VRLGHVHFPYSLRSTGILLCEADRLPAVLFSSELLMAKPPVPFPKRPARKPAHEVRQHCLRVLVNDTEKDALQAMARQTRRSVGRYLREVGQGYRLTSAVDHEAVRELAKVNGDLGRLGGLLKIWLADDPRTARFTLATVEVLLARIEARQEAMGELMQRLVRPRAEA